MQPSHPLNISASILTHYLGRRRPLPILTFPLMRVNLFPLASLVALPLLSAAQTLPSSPKYYVGVGASVLTGQIVHPAFYSSGPNMVGPALTFGMRLTPHWGAQIGVAYSWRTKDDTYFYDGQNGFSSFSRLRTRTQAFTVPLLLRYSFMPNPGRFHIDALGGTTLLHTTTSYDSVLGIAANSGEENSISTNLTLGPALRYSLIPKVELSVASFSSVALNKNYGDLKNRLFYNVQVGLNYAIGQ
ncbi:MAG: outer membrane beta-barrel protein [Janthinobacterium lividum]